VAGLIIKALKWFRLGEGPTFCIPSRMSGSGDWPQIGEEGRLRTTPS
jgi:hypothetical protein